jgi:hypothetical protein
MFSSIVGVDEESDGIEAGRTVTFWNLQGLLWWEKHVIIDILNIKLFATYVR